MLFASIGMIINPVFFLNNVSEIMVLTTYVWLAKLVVVTSVASLHKPH